MPSVTYCQPTLIAPRKHLGLAVFLAATLFTTSAHAACPSAPLASANDMIVSFLASVGTQAAPSTLYTSTVEEGMLLYDNATNSLKICDGTNWSKISLDGSTVAAGTVAGAVQFRGAGGLLAADDANFVWDDTNNRLGIGTTTPSYRLDATTTAIDFAARFKTSTASGATVALAHAGSYGIAVDVGSGGVAANYGLDISKLGTSMFRVTGAGNVGIGTTTPAGRMHILTGTSLVTPNSNADELIVEKGSGDGGITIANANNAKGIVYFGDPEDPASGRIIYDHVDNSLRLGTNSAERMRIDTSGNVGIGTTSPGVKLDISDPSVSGGPSIQLSAASASANSKNWRIQSSPADLSWGTFAIRPYNDDNSIKSSGLVILGNGNVGIGTATPGQNLDVQGNYGSGLRIRGPVVDGNWYGGIQLTNTTAAVPGATISASTNGLFFGYGGVERLRISAGGLVGIGTAAPSAKLDVAGAIKIVDGTQGAGKVLTSDANGLASWATPSGGSSGIPTKTLAQRIAMSPVTGDVIYNSSKNQIEWYNGTNWYAANGSPALSSNHFTSCKAILDNGASTGDGIYTIDPTDNDTGFSAYCDMTTDGGGWTAIKYVYDTTAAPASAASHQPTNYFLSQAVVLTLLPSSSSFLFREDSTTTLAKLKTSQYATIRANIENNRGWFYGTHGTSNLSGWMDAIGGNFIPDAQQIGCNGYPTTNGFLTVLDSCGNGNGSHLGLNTHYRMRTGSHISFRVNSIWIR